MKFYDFQLRGWVTDRKQIATLVHSSPAGTMRRPQIISPNWNSLNQFEQLLQSVVAQADIVAIRMRGEELGRSLFSDEVEELLRESLDRVGPDNGLRVRLCLDETLSKLPWEYLNLPCVGGFLTQDPRFSLTREAPLSGSEMPRIGAARRMLFFGVRNCAADGSDQWQTAAESDRLNQVIGPATSVVRMQSYLSNDCNCGTALRNAERPIDIFHYSGHTDVEAGMGYLITEEMRQDGGVPARLNSDALGSMLRRAGTTMAVFSACNSGNWDFVRPLLSEGIPVIIGARGLVEVRVATAFCERLYKSLTTGLSLDEAVNWARLHLLEPNVLPDFLRWQWGTFIVYMQTSDPIIFHRPSAPAVQKEQTQARAALQETIDRAIKNDKATFITEDWTGVDQKARRSILYLETTIVKRDGTNRRTQHGTAFVSKVTPSGAQALTAEHTVPEPASDELAEYRVALRSRQGHLAAVKVIKRDRDLDIARLSLPDTEDWIPLEIGSSDKIALGSSLYTLGFPLSSDLAGASGLLSNVQGPKGTWQTSLPIEHGNSGGPVLDADGKVVAIASGGIDGARGMTYAVPIDYS